jgi:hypothetical protein
MGTAWAQHAICESAFKRQGKSLCQMLALLGAHHIFHNSRIRDKNLFNIFCLPLREPVWRSWYSDYATSWMIQGSGPGSGNLFLSSPKKMQARLRHF